MCRLNGSRGFSLIECLVVMLLASLLMILTVELQFVFLKQWRHQETLIEWQENQRLGYSLFKSWLQRLQTKYDNDFELILHSPSEARVILPRSWQIILPQANSNHPLLVAYSSGEIDSIWYISKTSGLFYKEKDLSAHELLTDVAGWQCTIEKNQLTEETHYFLSITMEWEKPLQQWSAVSWQYVYARDQESEESIINTNA